MGTTVPMVAVPIETITSMMPKAPMATIVEGKSVR